MPDDTDSMITVLMIVSAVVFFALSFFLRLCCTALSEALPSELKKLSEDGKKGASRALAFAEDDNAAGRADAGAGTAFVFGFAFLYTALSGKLFSALSAVAGSFLLPGAAAAAAFAVISAVAAVLLYAVFVTFPGLLGTAKPERTICASSGVFAAVSAFAAPVYALCSIIARGFIRIFGQRLPIADEKQTEQEILQMVGEGEQNGLIEGTAKDMIENVFDFDDTKVSEIMTHRRDIIAVRDDAGIREIAKAAIESGNSRIPVYHEDIDDIVGMIHVKELLKYIGIDAPDGRIPDSMIKEAVFVPGSKCCSEMFEYMTSHKTQIAVVVDEFGGTEGLVTMEDLVEAIVGSIQDEFDDEDEDIEKLDENRFTVDGATSLDEISELTGLDFDEDDNDTIAGIMLDRMGHIPKSGEHPSVMIHGTRFTVQEVSGRRISKVLVVRPSRD